MSEYRIIRAYPYPIVDVWDVFTVPELMGRWTTTGRGGRPEGFSLVPGSEFRYVAKPVKPFWNGIVNCRVLEVDAPRSLHYTWTGDEGGDITDVTYTLEPTDSGTRFAWEHTGFTGLGGLFMARLLGRVRTKMMDDGVPRVLAQLQNERGQGA